MNEWVSSLPASACPHMFIAGHHHPPGRPGLKTPNPPLPSNHVVKLLLLLYYIKDYIHPSPLLSQQARPLLAQATIFPGSYNKIFAGLPGVLPCNTLSMSSS